MVRRYFHDVETTTFKINLGNVETTLTDWCWSNVCTTKSIWYNVNVRSINRHCNINFDSTWKQQWMIEVEITFVKARWYDVDITLSAPPPFFNQNTTLQQRPVTAKILLTACLVRRQVGVKIAKASSGKESLARCSCEVIAAAKQKQRGKRWQTTRVVAERHKLYSSHKYTIKASGNKIVYCLKWENC